MNAWPPKGWKEEQKRIQADKKTKPILLLNILSFIIPLYGIIYFLINKVKKPISAKSYFLLSCIGLVIYIVFSILACAISRINVDNLKIFLNNLTILFNSFKT